MEKSNGVVLLALISIVCLFSCKESESTIGFSELDSKTQTVMIDTFTVRTSTVLLDSINSSGTGKIIVGSYHDPILGKISSSSYFQIAPNPVSWSIEANAVFDSVALLLTPDHYYYGDTTVVQELIVQQLNQDLVGRTVDKNIFRDVPYSYFYSDGGIYNTSKTKAFGSELARFNYSPSPHKSDSIIIRLNDDLGEYWFDLAKVNDQQISGIGNFLSDFKGLKISTSNKNASVCGFNSAKAKVRVYYHASTNAEYIVNASFDLPIYQSELQYNQYETDFSSTDLSSLQRGKSIASTVTNQETFIQGGSGVITKIEFPYLHLLNELNENITILHASLVVSAVREYPQVYDLPSEICLYYTNDLNIPTNFVADEITLTKTNTATLSTDKELGLFSRYSFLVTTYISALIKGESYPKELFVGLNITDLPETVTRLRVGGENHPDFKIKLQVYYSRYQNSQ